MTPMMEQYWKIKNQHQEHLVFYRLGDFYELFYEDAKTASKELELTLTGRDCGEEQRAPMCGVPYHSADNYIARLIKKGYKVAVCEQMEDPAKTKGMVRREVVRVITPGTVVEGNLLSEDTNNYICCICRKEEFFGAALADTSVGALYVGEFPVIQTASLRDMLGRYSPREYLLSPDLLDHTGITNFIREKMNCTADVLPAEDFLYENALRHIEAHYRKTVKDLGFEENSASLSATGALLRYLYETQRKGLEQITDIAFLREDAVMRLPLSSRRNLELTQTLRSGERRGSLLWVLDKTKTPMGKRLLRSWLEAPLTNVNEINSRLQAVGELTKNTMLRQDFIEDITGLPDFERYLARVLYGSASPRELWALAYGLSRLPALKQRLSDCKAKRLIKLAEELHPLDTLSEMILKALKDPPPATRKEGELFQEGFDPRLDEVNGLLKNTKQVLLDMEQQEREQTGIKNLKVGYNRVFGYYIEVSKGNLSFVPETYIRKQTLANCERFITEDLKTLEERILAAGTEAANLESELYQTLLDAVAAQTIPIKQTAAALAQLDVLSCFAHVAVEHNYCCPTVDLRGEIRITDGRHPVIEQIQRGAPFVANDTLLNNQQDMVAVITGPNMAGKSTFMRQTALIVLMAQMGCFVPAKEAVIGVVDGIFTRVGAMDDLSSGQSTFMVEMTELAELLTLATSRSLLILDEIGRGTSTFDGMSIARSVVEYIANPKQLGAKTLFATHYHELTSLEGAVSGVKNYNIACKKRGDEIIFLRRIVPGGADDSYGIEVSKLAGVPDTVIRRAKTILKELENGGSHSTGKISKKEAAPPSNQISFLPSEPSQVEEQLLKLDLNTVTPLEALQILFNLRKLIQ